ncbi:LysR family transcriptional regulator [Tsukamurella pseudospumae]|uniref:LysR family transcriptional regulator n=1 Tax=Tsukamurella pseudospumae TaxID=239498 RepID=UPI0009E6F0AB|nr:LysR family transcriptional regulator [Tsukamurella pseudospumae]
MAIVRSRKGLLPYELYTRRMELELRHLRVLVALTDSGSHTAAARVLGVSQPTVTRTVQQMEAIAGTPLVQRGGIELTDAGVEVVERARRVLAEVEALGQDLEGRGVIRLAFAWLLPEAWYRAVRRSAVSAGNSTAISRVDDPMAALVAGTADVSIHREPLPRPPAGIRVATIGTEHRVLAVSEYDPAFPTNEPVRWDDVARRPVVVNTVSGSTTAESLPGGPDDTQIVECQNFDEWLELVASGEGVGPVPEICARRVLHPHVRYLPLLGAPATHVQLAWRGNPTPASRIRSFVDAAVTHPLT